MSTAIPVLGSLTVTEPPPEPSFDLSAFTACSDGFETFGVSDTQLSAISFQLSAFSRYQLRAADS
jgi:hypothetical protein